MRGALKEFVWLTPEVFGELVFKTDLIQSKGVFVHVRFCLKVGLRFLFFRLALLHVLLLSFDLLRQLQYPELLLLDTPEILNVS